MNQQVCLPENMPAQPSKHPSWQPKNWWQRYLYNTFYLDRRSVNLFRVGLGALVIVDLFVRATSLIAFYTDGGIAPRLTVLAHGMGPWIWSVHLMGGTWWWQAFLFSVTAVAALCMIFGYRARLMAFMVWALTVSLHNRTSIVLQGGDLFLRMLLFWAWFVPLAGSWRSKKIFSWGTAGLVLQVMFVYMFAVAAKSKTIWVLEGSAIEYALSIDEFAKASAHWLLQYPEVMRWLSRLTFFIQFISPILLLIPFWRWQLRFLAVFLLIAMHAGMGFFMALGPFPWVAAVGILVLLPTPVWDAFFRWWQSRENPVSIYYDADCGFCLRMVHALYRFLGLKKSCVYTAQSHDEANAIMTQNSSWVVQDAKGRMHVEWKAGVAMVAATPLGRLLVPILLFWPIAWLGRFIYRIVSQNRSFFASFLPRSSARPLAHSSRVILAIIAIFSLVTIVWWNVYSVSRQKITLPVPIQWFGAVTRIDQGWDMFHTAFVWDGWYVLAGKKRNGDWIDVFRGGQAVSWEKPGDIVHDYPNERWRKFMMVLWQEMGVPYRHRFARYMCYRWNNMSSEENRIDYLRVFYTHEVTKLKNESPHQTQLLVELGCG